MLQQFLFQIVAGMRRIAEHDMRFRLDQFVLVLAPDDGGFEDRVVQELTNRIKALGMEGHFGEIRVPKVGVVGGL